MLLDKGFIDSTKKIGFDGVELNTDQNYAEDRLHDFKKASLIKEESIIQKIEIHSISISAIRDFDFYFANKNEFFSILKIVNHISKVGSKIGAKYLMFPFFRINHKTIKKRLTIDRIRQLVNIAKSNNIKIAIESFLSPNDLLDLLHQINSDFLKICFDVGIATACNYELFNSIIKLKDKIGYFHIKDSNCLITSKNVNADFSLLQKLRTNSIVNNSSIINGGSYWNVPLGKGDVDFSAIKKALKLINYKGFLILETQPRNNPIRNAKLNLSLLKGFISSL